MKLELKEGFWSLSRGVIHMHCLFSKVPKSNWVLMS